MKELVACAEASRLDAATGRSVPALLLMEDASLLIWQRIQPLARSRGAGEGKLLLAICGSGNNGGDALAVLRHARGAGFARIAAILAKDPGELAAIYATSLKALGVELHSWGEDRGRCEALIAEADFVIDGLAGTGQSGALREPQASILEAVNQAAREGRLAIASIDLPSGLSDNYEAGWPLAEATWTLSVEPRKACLYYPMARESCGEILPIAGVFPIDAPRTPSAQLLEESDLRALAPLPSDSAFKGTRGRVAVFAGSIGASGAAVLCSRACLAAGAGVASLFASRELLPLVAPMLEAVMVKEEPADLGEIARRYDALLIGPGWGRSKVRKRQLELLLRLGLPAVLDADAIHLYRELMAEGFQASAPIILTPHPGELSALTGVASEKIRACPPLYLAKAAKEFHAAIAFKTQVTWIGMPSGELAVWEGRESGLGTAGSGDVLAGVAAGLLARAAAAARDAGEELESRAVFSATAAAVIAHGLAGRAAREARGWFEASAILEEAAKLLGLRSGISP